MFKLKLCPIAGCFELHPKIFNDIRGSFVKTFHEPTYAALGLETNFAEEFFTISHKGVIRGLHFQTPPADQVKIVYCAHGEVMDVVVDLRVGSPTFGQHATFTLSAKAANILYIPKGMAHGFCALSDEATLAYKVNSTHSPAHDRGVLWSSAGIMWPTTTPILSDRDRSFPPLNQFASPFVYNLPQP